MTPAGDRASAELAVTGRDGVVCDLGVGVAVGAKTGFGVGVGDSGEASILLTAKSKSAAAMGADAPFVRVPNELSRFTVQSYLARRTAVAR